ncbi:prepilin-type N-terminal cleavage/methylation domain-containing protein [Pelomonas sp. SE-A7]|uniref:PilW family protein n=1 Tax=Pelomonas sp. SE-A7 TaxID=3054953 RepID=UPI00259CE6E0|nr:prepilin-type N-terminal cleavage/methylation domain-containing protein [Pelomonas sp. SE-A7]MDM4765107.1 prepilin-type N-terminal cleavage/methylation domain-containing protein [Pelomonas sp. SE-A7]
MPKLTPTMARQRQRGLGLVETMVGITVGLIVVAGATLMVTNQITDHKRLVLETQVQQDLRATADLVLREVRRAGYWATATDSVWAPGSAAPTTTNPYASMTPASAASSNVLTISASKAERPAQEDNITTADETHRFRLVNGTLYYQLSTDTSDQPLTDPNSVRITEFTVKLNVQTVPLSDFCTTPCSAGNANCPPVQLVRHVLVTISGQAVHDQAVTRSVEVGSRLRNDSIVGNCS